MLESKFAWVDFLGLLNIVLDTRLLFMSLIFICLNIDRMCKLAIEMILFRLKLYGIIEGFIGAFH